MIEIEYEVGYFLFNNLEELFGWKEMFILFKKGLWKVLKDCNFKNRWIWNYKYYFFCIVY